MKYRAIAISLLLAIAAFVSAAERPAIKTHTMAGLALQTMSDNGRWALAWGAEEDVLSPVLINVETDERFVLQTEADQQQTGLMLAYDVTDDGNIVVGAYNGQPAYLNRSTGEWTILPCSMESGTLRAVTPDGKFAVGSVNNGDIRGTDYMPERPAMWDLTTNTDVTPMDMPAADPYGESLGYFYVRCTGVSADGRYVLIQSLAYGYASYIYDRQSEDDIKWTCIGFSTNNGTNYEKTVSNLIAIQPMYISPNGQWALCSARVSAFNDEFVCPARYNIQDKTLEVFDNTLDDMDILPGCIDNDGNVYAGTPTGSPLREFLVRNDGYWYSLRTLLKQKYGMDYELSTGYENTGTPMAVSTDGRTFIGFSDPKAGENWTLKMNESLVDICNEINLLGIYTVSPAAGSVFTKLREIKVTFDRDIEVIGEQTAATFGEWTSVSTNGIVVDPADSKSLIVTFRTRTLSAGQEYKFTIPAGTICIKGDRTRVNEDISTTYIGRENTPVAVQSVYPADGSVLAKLDNSTSPVQLTMDYPVKTAETASAALYASDGTRLSRLSVTCSGKTVLLYPPTTQYLFAGEEYKVVLAAGSLTDLSGSGANEEFTINYTGSYEREVSPDNATIFADDFNNISRSLATWMLYDNDHLSPAEDMLAMEFDADNTPWNFSIRDNLESTDFAAASHSIYSPAGRSDDWMVTPQLYIPDNKATLTFDAQSLLTAKNDVLKVVVWECQDVYNVLSAEAFARLSAEGRVLFEQRLSPGENEQTLAGDWTSYSVSLADYAGKSIYIAFVNQNDNQSMLFVDNVKVMREMPYLLSLSNKQSVVSETGIKIAGTFTVNSANGFAGGYLLTLCDAEGQAIDTYDYRVDMLVPAGTTRSFAFEKPLPLTVGEENRFSIKVEFRDGVDGETVTDEVKSSVKSLTFNPLKRVVLEEVTGTTCGNCPQGIIAIERMKEIYGEQFIPISIHTYDGDPWGAGLYSYAASLGLNAAPTAIVNRNSDILMPMIEDPETFDYTLSYYGYLWLDRVAEELNTPADLEVSATVTADESRGEFSMPVTLRSALNMVNLNLNVFLVFMEDYLKGVQHNYFASSTDPILGEWGMGGRYGQNTATGVTHNDVVRYAYDNSGSYSGFQGMLPQSLKAGEEFTMTIFGELPGTYETLDNTKFAVILIDANTNKVVNACLAWLNPANAIESVTAPSRRDDSLYNLAGQKVGADYKGIVIKNGRKILKK